MARNVRISHDEFALVLRRAGYPRKVIEEITAQLPDPIDVERDKPILDRYDITRERLMDRMGAEL
jgi:hypothetical protein